jgi:hypothetical protein
MWRVRRENRARPIEKTSSVQERTQDKKADICTGAVDGVSGEASGQAVNTSAVSGSMVLELALLFPNEPFAFYSICVRGLGAEPLTVHSCQISDGHTRQI